MVSKSQWLPARGKPSGNCLPSTAAARVCQLSAAQGCGQRAWRRTTEVVHEAEGLLAVGLPVVVPLQAAAASASDACTEPAKPETHLHKVVWLLAQGNGEAFQQLL